VLPVEIILSMSLPLGEQGLGYGVK
jgi:hypothetical protein